MYQLMQLQYTTYLAWTTFVKIWLPSRAPNTNSWQVDYLVSGCSTSLPLCVLTRSHPSTQISANAVFPLSTKTHPLLRNERVIKTGKFIFRKNLMPLTMKYVMDMTISTNHCLMNTKASRQNSKIFTKRKAKKPCSAQKPAGLEKVRNLELFFLI